MRPAPLDHSGMPVEKEFTVTRKIFVNLPVTDLTRAVAFYEAVGFRNDPQFTDDTAACMVADEHIHVMLLTHAKFAQFTPLPIGDATRSTEVMIALSCDSREAVDDMVGRAAAAGGSTFRDPEDHGFMYGHAFRDPDGHIWEPLYLDAAALSKP